MKIGFRILNNAVVVFGADGKGDQLPPNIGSQGYNTLSTIARQRGGAGAHEADQSVGKLIHLIETAQENPEGFLPDGFYIIEILGSGTASGLHLYDGHGTHVLGPVQDSVDIVMAIARQSRQNPS